MNAEREVIIVYRTHPQYFTDIMKKITKEIKRDQLAGTQQPGFSHYWTLVSGKEFDQYAEKKPADRRNDHHAFGLSDWAKVALSVIAWAVCLVMLARHGLKVHP